jgi:excisionase family DNA binding protein
MAITRAAPLCDFAGAAAWLGVPEDTVRKAVAARRYPHVRIGKHVRFTIEDLNAIAAMNHVEPGTSARAAEMRRRSKGGS